VLLFESHVTASVCFYTI